jgi:hypothetical protein
MKICNSYVPNSTITNHSTKQKTIRMIELSTNKDNMAILYDNKNNIIYL